jgi:LEA14-like dessication related protein
VNGVAYILEIDGIEMTQGLMNAPFRVGAGEKTVLPINMSFDLKQTMSGQALNAIKDLAFNFVGIGEGASNVTVRLKPNFSVGGRIISSPAYIPVSFVLKK